MEKLFSPFSQIILAILPFLIVFIATIYMPFDADLGWHLKYGEHFFKTGQILRDNTFSTLMPDYKWSNTSWGIDLVEYWTFNNFGFIGLSLLTAAVITLTFFFFSLAFNLSLWQKTFIFPGLLMLESPVNEVSFRGQLVSLMLLGILYYFITRYEDNKSKIIYFLPALFLFWANLHGLFILGLGLFLIWIINYSIKTYLENEKNIISTFREIKYLILVFVLSALITLVNPFGFGIIEIAFTHFNNPFLKYISEYLPFEEASQQWWNQITLGVLIMFGVMFLYFGEKIKQSITHLSSIGILYTLSFFVKRYTWALYYLTIPFLKPVADFFKPDSEKYTKISASVILLATLAITVWLKNPTSTLQNMSWDIYCKKYMLCSPKAVEYIRKNNLKDNLYTFYTWGGWMIWNYPDVKPTIDGRMHLWKDKNGYSAFEHYYPYEQDWYDIDSSKYDVVLMGAYKPVYKRLLELVEEGRWKLVYKDENAGVFVRIKSDKNI